MATRATAVAGTFTDREAAHKAVHRLLEAGVPPAAISMIVREEEPTTQRIEAETGVRGGAAAPVNPIRPDVEPVLRTRVEGDEIEPVTPQDYSAAAAGATSGAILGGLTGFLAGLGAIFIPGLGPVLAVGPLAAAFGGTAIGAAAGGLLGALVDAGMSSETASTYADAVERGHVLVTVDADTASRELVRDLLEQAGALNLYPARTMLV